MCGLGACHQISITIFSLLFTQSATFFGGCVFFGHIQMALIAYMIVVNIATATIFVADKCLAKAMNPPSKATAIFMTDYDVFDINDNNSRMELVKSMTVRRSRVYEKVLLLMVFCGGVAGAWIAMVVFQHKIKKIKFLKPMVALTFFNLLPLLVWLTVTSDQHLHKICLKGW